MVAYSFRKQFAEPILDGTKGGTIRAPRKRHARAGEQLQLYTGQRTQQCKLICRLPCRAVEPVRLEFKMPTRIVVGARVLHTGTQLTLFAQFDGFTDFDAMRDFWYETHPALPFFDGVHIRWLDLPAELQEAA